jgi:hypothetical protein
MRRIPLMDAVYPEKLNHHIGIILDKDDPNHDSLIEAFVRSFGEEFVGCESLDKSRTRLKVYPGGALALLNRKPPFCGKQEATA